MIALVLGYYYYLSNRKTVDDVDEVQTEVTVVQQLINKNYERNYPPTPKEVLKAYADITVAFYTESYSDEEFNLLALKIRELYDEELKDANPMDSYLSALKNEITSYRNEGISFSSYSTSASTDVDYFNEDGYDFARIDAAFTAKQGTSAGLVKEVFLMRKDDEGHWKIYGWTMLKE